MSDLVKMSEEDRQFVGAVYAELDAVVRRRVIECSKQPSLVLLALTSMAGTVLGCFNDLERPVARAWCLDAMDKMAAATNDEFKRGE